MMIKIMMEVKFDINHLKLDYYNICFNCCVLQMG